MSQASTSATAGNNAINLDGDLVTGQTDVVGQVSSNGSSAFSGLADANKLFVPNQLSSVPLAGTFTADTTNAGRYTGTLNLNAAIAPYRLVFYQANGGVALHVLEDPVNSGSGVIEAQQ